jgi:hypothetical protein
MDNVTPKEREDALRGADMQREKYYWKFPTYLTHRDAQQQATQALHTWHRRARVAGHLSSDVRVRLPTSESAALKLMGDAVAVPVVKALTRQLFEPALGVEADGAVAA